MKTCSKCGETKQLSCFSFKSKDKGILHGMCKSCLASYNKQHYKNNSDSYKDKARTSRTRIKKENKDYILDYLRTHPCVDCGESDIEVLQFDHIELIGSKGRRVTSMLNCSLKKVKEEISKCDVRCANCHVRRTRKQLGWERILND